jgi:hypothetical protein
MRWNFSIQINTVDGIFLHAGMQAIEINSFQPLKQRSIYIHRLLTPHFDHRVRACFRTILEMNSDYLSAIVM